MGTHQEDPPIYGQPHIQDHLLSSGPGGSSVVGARRSSKPPKVPLVRDLWSLLDGGWGVLTGSWGVLVPIIV